MTIGNLALTAALLLTGCVSNPRGVQNHSFFGGEQGSLANGADPAAPTEVGPSEWEIDTGFGVAVTPPKTWESTAPSADFGLVMTSPSGSVVRLEAYRDEGGALDQVKKWHEDFSKLAAGVIEPLAEAELAGNKAWMAKYQFLVDDAVISQTVWELPQDDVFYRFHVGVAEVSDRYESQTILDSLRFVPAPRRAALSSEVLGASIDNNTLGKARISVVGWEKMETCSLPGCVASWAREDAAIYVMRRDFASEAAAKRDLPLWVAQLERLTGSSGRLAKFGKNSGQLIEGDGMRVWFGQVGTSLWTVKLQAESDSVRSFSKVLDKTIASARFK